MGSQRILFNEFVSRAGSTLPLTPYVVGPKVKHFPIPPRDCGNYHWNVPLLIFGTLSVASARRL